MIDETFPEQPSGGALPAASAMALPRARLSAVTAAWERVALAGTLLLAALLNFYQLSREGYGDIYYAAGVKSMLESWHNFFFAAFDPGGFVTIDKPPLGFWLQAASARLFGFHGWSLMLPAALAGVLSVALLYHLVRSAFGPAAGILAGLALAVTPVAVAANRSNIVDGILVFFVLLGAWAVLRAVETDRLRWLLAGMLFVGLGFNVKMLEAFLVVPAFLLTYLVGSRLRWRTRLWHLVLAAIVLMIVSLSWATAVDLTPASQRPYVGSSSNNSEYNLIFGYNGLQRLLGRRGSFFSLLRTITGTTEGANGAALGGPGGPGGIGETGAAGWLRLFNQQLGGQSGWLLPLALIGFLAVAWRKRPSLTLPLDARQRQLVLWGTWLLTGVIFFSFAGFIHTYYLVMLAPPIAALSGAGLVSLWSDYRAGSWRGWLLPLSLVAVALAQRQLLQPYPSWSRWLSPAILALGIGAALVLVVAGLLPRLNVTRLPLLAATVGALALLLAPTAWAAETTLHDNGGMLPVAGPRASRGGFGGFGGFATGRGGRGGFGQPPGGAGLPGQQTDSALLRYLESQQGTTRFLVAVDNANTAGPIILETGKPVMALGGFTGSDPILTTDQLAELVKSGSVRFFLLGGGFGGFGGFGGARTGGSAPPDGFGDFSRPGDRLEGEQPPAGSYLVTPTQGRTPEQGRSGAPPTGFGDRGGNLMSWVTGQCTAVPASSWGPNGSGQTGGFGGEQLYDCANVAKAG